MHNSSYASEKGYEVPSDIRTEFVDGTTACALAFEKTRTAPLRKVIYHTSTRTTSSAVGSMNKREADKIIKTCVESYSISKGTLAADHVLVTFLAEVESILNSGSLVRSSENKSYTTTITPAHLLLQRLAAVLPPRDFFGDF